MNPIKLQNLEESLCTCKKLNFPFLAIEKTLTDGNYFGITGSEKGWKGRPACSSVRHSPEREYNMDLEINGDLSVIFKNLFGLRKIFIEVILY